MLNITCDRCGKTADPHQIPFSAVCNSIYAMDIEYYNHDFCDSCREELERQVEAVFEAFCPAAEEGDGDD